MYSHSKWIICSCKRLSSSYGAFPWERTRTLHQERSIIGHAPDSLVGLVLWSYLSQTLQPISSAPLLLWAIAMHTQNNPSVTQTVSAVSHCSPISAAGRQRHSPYSMDPWHRCDEFKSHLFKAACGIVRDNIEYTRWSPW